MQHATRGSRWRTAVLATLLGLAVTACATVEEAADSEPAEGAEPVEGPTDDMDDAGAETADDGPADDGPADEVEGGERLTIVATTSILGDIVGTLIGDDGDVTVLMGPGVDPHAYQPSAADAALLREADLVIANGLGLEANLVAALEAAEQDGARVYELADHLDPIAFAWDGPGHSHDDEHGHDDEQGTQDPHIWFDPIRMADGVELMAAELAAVWDGIDPEEWRARADAYNTELLAVHEDMGSAFGAIPDERRRLVTNHDALGYLADRYGFEIVGTVVPGATTQAEADARAFAELIETVEDAGVDVVFAENTDTTVLAEQLASEVVGRGDLDIEVVRIYTDALGEEGSGAETYLGLLHTTAQLIADALG